MTSAARVLLVTSDDSVGDCLGKHIEREAEDLRIETVPADEPVPEHYRTESIDCVAFVHDRPSADDLRRFDRLASVAPDVPVVVYTIGAQDTADGTGLIAEVSDVVTHGETDANVAALVESVTDAIERDRATESLAEKRRRLELIGRASSDVFWDWDLETDEVTWSEGYAEMFGFDPETVSTDADWWTDRFHPDDEEDVRQAANAAIAAGEHRYSVDYRLETADGSYKPVRMRAYVVYDDDGDPFRIVGAVTDISDLVRQNERLHEFSSIVSHDLRNPLQVLDGALELAAETGDPDHFDRCRRAVDRMDQLVEDLLSLAREGEDIDDPEPVALAETVKRCWMAVDSGTVTLEVDGEATLLADPGRLRQLLENLLANAVEHGGDRIVVEATADGFAVADDGPGIPPDDRETVFESGYSTDAGGTGFGLAIAEQIVEAHGWTIDVTESRWGGARFVVSDVERPE